jgi:2,4-dienoyl-CoA reductase-like NADH-dependent reductase (Old Yellow Enzyme family)
VSLLFSPLTFQPPQGPLTLANRIVIAPMCQYSAEQGRATDWHLMHWGQLLNSGAGMLTLEATAVSAEGRITPGCLGLWDEATAAALHDKLDRARALGRRPADRSERGRLAAAGTERAAAPAP